MTPHRHAWSKGALLAVLVALATGAVAGYFVRPVLSRSQPRGGGDSAARPEAIAALGRVQPRGGVIPIYGPPGDRVGRLYDLAVGKKLTAAAPVADLASKPEREQEVAVAGIQLAEIEQQVVVADKAAKAKIATAELEAVQLGADEESDKQLLATQVEVLEHQQRLAKNMVERLRKIRTDGVKVSDEEWEQATLLQAKADAELEAARLRKDKALAGYKRGKELAAAKIAAARADLAEATARVPIRSTKAKLALARQMLALTTIKAPVDGTVLKIVSRAGEPTGSHQPIVYIADTSRMVIVAELYESDVPRLREGLAKGVVFTATITSPALPRDVRWKGTLRSGEQLTRMIARNSIFALSPREDTDRRVIEVSVELDPDASEAAGEYVGLQVNVELAPERK